MSTITWTTNDLEDRYIATNKNGWEIGRINVSYAKTDQPFWAHSANGTTKRFFVLYRAKEWVEDSYSDVAETIESA